MDVFIIICVLIFILLIGIGLIFNKVSFLYSRELFITKSATDIYKKLNKNVERYIKDYTGSYITLDNGDKVYAYRRVKKIISNLYFIKNDRILFKYSEMYDEYAASSLIKSRKTVSKFNL